MTDIHDLRAQMRDSRTVRPVVGQGGGFRIPFGLVAGAAVGLGFLVVLFTPKIYSVQRTSTLPAFKEARQEPVAAPAPIASVQPAAVAAPPPAAVGVPPASTPGYAGKNAKRGCQDRRCGVRATPHRGAAARAGGGRGEAPLFPQRRHRAVLHGQPGAQGDRRYHQLFQRDRVHQYGDGSGREAAGTVPLSVGRYVAASRSADAGSARRRSDRRADARRSTEPGASRGYRRERAARVQGSLRACRRHQDAVSGSRRGGRSGSSSSSRDLVRKPVPTFGITRHFPSAASISLTASSLAHSAGPASVPSSQPCGSTSSVVGMPNALPAALRS